MKSFASRIKANSLSDIESIDSDAENDESSLIPKSQSASMKSKNNVNLDLSEIKFESKCIWQNELVPQLVVIEEI